MKKNRSMKIKNYIEGKWSDFADWFTEKEHPRSILNKNVFFHDSIKFVGLILIFLIVYSNVDKLNQIVLILVKLGSALQLGLLFFILRKAWHLVINLKYFFRGLNHGVKAIIAIVVVLLILLTFFNQDSVVDSVIRTYERIDFNKFNLLEMPSNFSIGNFSLDNVVNSVGFYTSIKDLNQNPSNYIGQSIDVRGKLNSRLGGYSLEDSRGYWVWIDDNCIEKQREYNYNSQIYDTKGVWLSPKKGSSFSWGVEYKHRLSCTSPLN